MTDLSHAGKTDIRTHLNLCELEYWTDALCDRSSPLGGQPEDCARLDDIMTKLTTVVQRWHLAAKTHDRR